MAMARSAESSPSYRFRKNTALHLPLNHHAALSPEGPAPFPAIKQVLDRAPAARYRPPWFALFRAYAMAFSPSLSAMAGAFAQLLRTHLHNTAVRGHHRCQFAFRFCHEFCKKLPYLLVSFLLHCFCFFLFQSVTRRYSAGAKQGNQKAFVTRSADQLVNISLFCPVARRWPYTIQHINTTRCGARRRSAKAPPKNISF